MPPQDSDLLREYVLNRSEPAFAELVRRHLNLVYSAANRHVHSPALAEDIAQSVFIDLSRNAARLKPGTPLVAWLHLVTRRTAIDVLRHESRRHAREQTAMEISAMEPSPSPWSQIEPLLDEAVGALPPADRNAVLLRYFESKSLREVGESLGLSDDAAQNRVSRALDQLRMFFARRGIVVTGAGLVSNLTAHAIQTAPLALGSTISSAVISLGAAALTDTAAAHTANALAMTTLKKTLITALAATVIGGGVYEATTFARQNASLAALQQHTNDLAAQLSLARLQQNTEAARLRSVEEQIDERITSSAARLSSGDAKLEAQMKSWLANLEQLKRLVERRPEHRTPEMQLLSEAEWFNAASNAKLDSDEGVRRALAGLRQIAENRLMNRFQVALSTYAAAHGGLLPDHIVRLLPFFDPPIEPAWLDRYEMLRSGKLSDLPSKNETGLIAAKRPVDVEYDSFWQMGINWFIGTSAMNHNLAEARRAFSAANPGRPAPTAAQLIPYLKWPVSETAVQKHLNPPSAAPR